MFDLTIADTDPAGVEVEMLGNLHHAPQGLNNEAISKPPGLPYLLVSVIGLHFLHDQ